MTRYQLASPPSRPTPTGLSKKPRAWSSWAVYVCVLVCLPGCGLFEGAKDDALDGKFYEVMRQYGIEIGPDLELFSLDPSDDEEAPPDDRQLHGIMVLGSVRIRDRETRRRIWQSLRDGIAESDGVPARCFIPRHVLRTHLDGQVLEYVICFECSQIHTFVDGVRREGFIAVTESPREVFNEILAGKGIALPDDQDR